MVIETRVQIQRIRLTYSKYSQLNKNCEDSDQKSSQLWLIDKKTKNIFVRYQTSGWNLNSFWSVFVTRAFFTYAILPRFQGYLAWVKVRGNLWYFSLVITQWAGSIWHPPCWSSKQKRDQILWPDGMHLIATDWK